MRPIVPPGTLTGAGGRPFAGCPLRVGPPGGYGDAVGTRTPGAGTAPMPDLVPPMQPAPGPLPDPVHDGDDWVVEFAWEGLRAVAHVRPDGLVLRTANGRDVAASFPELVEPLTRLAPRAGMVLDGTVVAVGEGGLPRRRQLQRRTAPARPSATLLRRTPVGFVVGDLLWFDGRDAVELPYRRRRELLEGLGLARPPVVVSPVFPIAEAEAVLRTAEEYGAEALHARHLDAPYRPGRRSRGWLRVPLRRSGLVAVGGWNPADPRRPDSVGALLLGVPAGRAGLRYVGRVGIAGEEQREVTALLARLAAPEGAASPFTVPPPAAVAEGARFTAPELVGWVEFTDWTADGRLRLPVWRGIADADGDTETRWVRPPGTADATGPTPGAAPPAGRSTPPGPPPAAVPAPRAEPAVPGPDLAPSTDLAPPDLDPSATGPLPAVETRRLEQHFVYNALNTIAALMRSDPVRARELLLGFADLTRAADRPEGGPGTLGDELAAVRAYLQLEQARFGPRLRVEIAVDEGLHALPMPPRRVLDAVRAVVQQRIEPRPGGGTVTVTAERAGGGCLVRVADRDEAGRSGEPTVVAPG